MSTLDRQPRINSGPNDALHEPRVDPGTGAAVPPRADRTDRMPTKLPRCQDMTKAPKYMPVKR